MKKILPALLLLLCTHFAYGRNADSTQWWHGIERTIRYQPEGSDFVIHNGNRRFTRALYGTNTGFRAEAGDLPEFGLYMPGMGGNIKLGIIVGDSSKWLINAANITARYRPGKMMYEITDPLLGKGKLLLELLCMANAEGIILQVQSVNVAAKTSLLFCYGGASGKKFSRDGDMGPDPESVFYLKPEYCTDNHFSINKNSFALSYGTGLMSEADPYVNRNFASDTIIPKKIGKEQHLEGILPTAMVLQKADAKAQQSPQTVWQSTAIATPVIAGNMPLAANSTYYIAIQRPDNKTATNYHQLVSIYQQAEKARLQLAERIQINTPDPYINTLGGVLATAADAIWESPTYLHGSIGWRMRLNGWRGPYVADPLGWHDRAKTHFRAYAKSQLTNPPTGPVIMDTALHLARSLEKLGTSIFSSGYICRNPDGDFRPHHYDMNLVFIDALIRHLRWTGDIAFAKEMWPVITRHLPWEKRNFDPDNDGLYDAYACIWASDALQYSGGAGTHSSAYNYMANKEAALIAKLIGEDSTAYAKEAEKILTALNQTLWMPDKGWYAEFKDALGQQLLHPYPAVWTLYHSLDSKTTDAFQAYQSMQYIDRYIPHIPVRAKGLDNGYQTISTSRWMPYDWSLNNVATAEVMHTALANWQAGRNDDAFKLFKSELLSTMYLGGSPGNIGQISFYDAARGEAYRDFADPVAMTSRSLVEGLFGIQPDALRKQLTIEPGFPKEWKKASISIPDISYSFTRNGNTDSYIIKPSLPIQLPLQLIVKANGAGVKEVIVNGQKVAWLNKESAIENPSIVLNCGIQNEYNIKITWLSESIGLASYIPMCPGKGVLNITSRKANMIKLFDPQNIIDKETSINKETTALNITDNNGWHTAFVQLEQNGMQWWQPINVLVNKPLNIHLFQSDNSSNLQFSIANYTGKKEAGYLSFNNEKLIDTTYSVEGTGTASVLIFQNMTNALVPGSNKISFESSNSNTNTFFTNWKLKLIADKKNEQVNLTSYFNDKVTNIFKNEYLSPRPATATLQLPTQGIGDWTHPLKTAVITDSGLRKLAGNNNEIKLPQGIPFSTPSDTLLKNILFTSQWDNYPHSSAVPLSGNASHIYLLMAGSTNPMQSRITNGAVIVTYTDNTADTLLLKNPENWYPIEQDYMDDGYAFQTNAPRPPRVHLKTGRITSAYDNTELDFNGKMIDGGAATVLDLPLQPTKTLKSLTVQAWTNDVVIGLMAATLIR